MSYPAEALQRALYDKIMNDTGLKSVMGGTSRAFDRVPRNPVFPYITIPDGQFIDDGDTCETDRYEVFVDLQVWSRAVGNIEAKRIAGALRDALLSGLVVPSWLVTTIQCTSIDHLTDPDGLTSRARVAMLFRIEPA
jgi:Protein of unknown function (DUF3168)